MKTIADLKRIAKARPKLPTLEGIRVFGYIKSKNAGNKKNTVGEDTVELFWDTRPIIYYEKRSKPFRPIYEGLVVNIEKISKINCDHESVASQFSPTGLACKKCGEPMDIRDEGSFGL